MASEIDATTSVNQQADVARKFRVAIFGHTGRGNYGHQLDTAWLQHDNVEIVGACDANKPGLLNAGKKLKLSDDQLFQQSARMLEVVRPDIVSICPRWVDQHHRVMMEAAERGIHIYTEKPFCRTPEEADEIIAACEMRHLKLAIAHPTRYSPMTKTVKKLINDNAIGNVLEIRMRGKEDRRGGGEDLWVLGSHLFDLLLELGYSPESCFASVMQDGKLISKENVIDGNEGLGPLAGDAISATFSTKEHVPASFQSVRNMQGKPSRYAMQIFGSKGVIEILEGPMPDAFILQDSSWSPGRSGKNWERVSSAGIGNPEPLTDAKYRSRHHLAILDLLACIGTDRDPKCSMYEGRQVVEMTMAIFESQRTGQPVAFPVKVRTHPLLQLK